jgi:hypothetical protein
MESIEKSMIEVTILLRDEIQLLAYTGEQGSIRLFLGMPKI